MIFRFKIENWKILFFIILKGSFGRWLSLCRHASREIKFWENKFYTSNELLSKSLKINWKESETHPRHLHNFKFNDFLVLVNSWKVHVNIALLRSTISNLARLKVIPVIFCSPLNVYNSNLTLAITWKLHTCRNFKQKCIYWISSHKIKIILKAHWKDSTKQVATKKL